MSVDERKPIRLLDVCRVVLATRAGLLWAALYFLSHRGRNRGVAGEMQLVTRRRRRFLAWGRPPFALSFLFFFCSFGVVCRPPLFPSRPSLSPCPFPFCPLSACLFSCLTRPMFVFLFVRCLTRRVDGWINLLCAAVVVLLASPARNRVPRPGSRQPRRLRTVLGESHDGASASRQALSFAAVSLPSLPACVVPPPTRGSVAGSSLDQLAKQFTIGWTSHLGVHVLWGCFHSSILSGRGGIILTSERSALLTPSPSPPPTPPPRRTLA